MASSGSSKEPGPSLPPSQSDQSQSEQPKERVWKLRGGRMSVGGCGKKSDRDTYMTLDLLFNFDDDPTTKVVELMYDPDVLKHARNHCCTSLGTLIFLEDCLFKDLDRAFVEYIHQECSLYQDRMKELARQDPSGGGASRFRSKKTIHLYKPTVEKLGQGDEAKYYLLASEIFCLTGELKMLTQQEIDNLPVIISWRGPPQSFSIDEKECYTLLTDIIHDFNLMQDPQFVSFPVAAFVSHLAGQVYRQIIEERANFTTQMSVSGPAADTGKSLAQTLGMKMFLGPEHSQSPTATMTEASFYEGLDEGNIYVREFTVKKKNFKMNTVDASFLSMAVPVIWERNERRVRVGNRSKVYRVNGVLHIDGNILRSDLEGVLPDHVLGKMKLNFTGSAPLRHPDLEELIKNMLKNADAMFKYLPVLMKLAIETCVPVVTRAEMEVFSHILRIPDDKREGQVIVSYDRVWKAIKRAIEQYNLKVPAVFMSKDIDRRSSTYFNSSAEDDMKAEEVAKAIIEVGQANLGEHVVEHSERSPSFRIKISDAGFFPPQLLQDLRRLKSTPSTFGGKPMRVVFLPESSLTEETIAALHALSCRLDQVCRLSAEEETRRWNAYADRFYARACKWGNEEDDIDDAIGNIMDDSVEEVEEKRVAKKKKIDIEEKEAEKEDNEEEGDKMEEEQLRCENPYCRDYNKVFKYPYLKLKHDRSSHHVKAIGPK